MVLGVEGVQGSVCLVFRVLGAGWSGCSVCWVFSVFRVFMVLGDGCSGCSVCWVFKVFRVFRVLFALC